MDTAEWFFLGVVQLIHLVRVLYLHHNLTLQLPDFVAVPAFLLPVNPEE